MINPLDKLKKLRGRSVREMRVRGGQAITAYSEQLGLSGKLPTDAEFFALLDPERTNGELSAEDLLENFGEWSDTRFFPAFADRETSIAAFRKVFGKNSELQIIARAEQILTGRFDLLGFDALNFGVPVDWHLEPISGKRSSLRHWKSFDETDSSETGDKKIVWELNRHQHFFTLGAAYWLTGDERFAVAFVMQISGWMAQNPPQIGVNWMSSLEIALRAVSWLWAFRFFKFSPNFAPTVFRDAMKFLYLHGRHSETYLSTFYSPNTHLTGEALGLYYLGTLAPEFKRAAHWRKLGSEILLAELDRQILPDGVYFERTTWYQRYTADFYTHFLILSRLHKEEFAPEETEKLETKLQLALDFLIYATRPDGTTALIGDDDGGRMLPLGTNGAANDFRATLATGAVLFNRGDYKFVAGKAAEETFWLCGTRGLRVFDALDAVAPDETAKAFADGGYYAVRSDWTNNADFLLVNAAPQRSGHAHADALAFEFGVGGRNLLVDAGTYSYDDAKARNYFRSGAAHNSLTVDGESASAPDAEKPFRWLDSAKIENKKWLAHGRFAFFAAAHDGFSRLADAGASEHRREFFVLNRDYTIMRDFVGIGGAHRFELNFHFDAKSTPAAEFLKSGATVVDERDETGAGLRLQVFGDDGTWDGYADSIAPCYGLRLPAPTLIFASEAEGSQEFFSFLLPIRAGVEPPEVAEITVDGGRGFAIESERFADKLIYGDGEMIRTEFFDSNFRFAWARFAAASQELEEFVLIGGSRFVYKGKEIVNYPKMLDSVVARRVGKNLKIQADADVFSVNLPQNLTSKTILRTPRKI